jgi:hypothetical protein
MERGARRRPDRPSPAEQRPALLRNHGTFLLDRNLRCSGTGLAKECITAALRDYERKWARICCVTVANEETTHFCQIARRSCPFCLPLARVAPTKRFLDLVSTINAALPRRSPLTQWHPLIQNACCPIETARGRRPRKANGEMRKTLAPHVNNGNGSEEEGVEGSQEDIDLPNWKARGSRKACNSVLSRGVSSVSKTRRFAAPLVTEVYLLSRSRAISRLLKGGTRLPRSLPAQNAKAAATSANRANLLRQQYARFADCVCPSRRNIDWQRQFHLTFVTIVKAEFHWCGIYKVDTASRAFFKFRQ